MTKLNSHWKTFKDIHKEKPEIYEVFKEKTNELIGRGVKRYSAYGIMHVVRFLSSVSMKPQTSFKISNNVIPFYARLYIRDYPQNKDFFKLHQLPTQEFDEKWIETI